MTTSSQRKAGGAQEQQASPEQLAAASRAQAIVRRHVPEGVSLVEQLLTERRRDASNG